jgi:hypothetical protein
MPRYAEQALLALFVKVFHGAVDAHYRAVYIWAKSQDGPKDPQATDTAPLHRAIAFNCDVAAATAAAAFAAAAACYFGVVISSPQLILGRPTTGPLHFIVDRR